MIDVEWRAHVEADSELREMLAAAAMQDAEAGFPQLSADDPVAPGTTEVLVWLLPDERSGQSGLVAPSLAGYLRIEPRAGVGELSYVVRPEFRSRGISTLLLEKIGLGLDGPEGWQGTGLRTLRIWARGSHPAALRMSLRFRRLGIRVAARRWQMVMPLKPGRSVDPGAEPGGPAIRPAQESDHELLSALWFADGRRNPPPSGTSVLMTSDRDAAVWVCHTAVEATEYGDAGRILAVQAQRRTPAGPDDPLRRALLVAGLEVLRDNGLRAGLITVDAHEESLVHEALSLGLMHDQTDVLYTVGAP